MGKGKTQLIINKGESIGHLKSTGWIDENNTNSDSPVLNLMKLMTAVILDCPEADLNQTTISDGRGGRIYL